MIEPRPTVTRLVQAIARLEGTRGDGARGVDVARRILERLHKELGKLIGPAGFDVLLARSLVLARRAHPVLDGITAGTGGALEHVDAASRDGAALDIGAMAVTAHFIELLVILIGEDLAMRLIRDAWPGAEVEEEKR